MAKVQSSQKKWRCGDTPNRMSYGTTLTVPGTKIEIGGKLSGEDISILAFGTIPKYRKKGDEDDNPEMKSINGGKLSGEDIPIRAFEPMTKYRKKGDEDDNPEMKSIKGGKLSGEDIPIRAFEPMTKYRNKGDEDDNPEMKSINGDKWSCVDIPNRMPFGPILKERGKGDMDNILDTVIKGGNMTRIIQKGTDERRATKFQQIFGSQKGGCIFIHENMLAIFKLDEDSSEPPGNSYDVMIITGERPVSVVTVQGNDEFDPRIIRYNKILSNRLKLALQRFTDQIITTICTTVPERVLSGKKLINMLDTKVEEDSYRLLADQLHMDERKRDYVTRAFVACLAFMTNKTLVKSKSDSEIPGTDITLLCMTQTDFLTQYSVPPFESSGKKPERMETAEKVRTQWTGMVRTSDARMEGIQTTDS